MVWNSLGAVMYSREITQSDCKNCDSAVGALCARNKPLSNPEVVVIGLEAENSVGRLN